MRLVGRSGNEYIYQCPFCKKDKSGHLYVNYVKKKFHCWVCDKGGDTDYLRKLLGETVKCVEDVSVLYERIREFGRSSITHEELTLPRGFKLIERDSLAYSYLACRGINQCVIETYGIGYAEEDDFSRIYFPDYNDRGELLYWVSRRYLDGDISVRYKNPDSHLYGVYSTSQLYNYHKARSYKTIAVAEGIISAISIGPNAVATYSKNWSTVQAFMIADSPAESVYIVYDGDEKAREKAKDLGNYLATICSKKIFVVDLPDEKDPNDITKEELSSCIMNRVEIPRKISVKGIL